MWDFSKNFQESIFRVFTLIKLLGKQLKVSNLGIMGISLSLVPLKVKNRGSRLGGVNPNGFRFSQQLGGFLWGV